MDKMNRKYLQQFMTDNNWPREAADSVLQYFDSFISKENCREVLMRRVEQYESNVQMDYLAANREVAKEAVSSGLGSYEAQLLLYLCFSRYLPVHYAKAGLPEQVCMASLEDLKWKALECHEIYGVWGAFVADWFPGFFTLSRFTLGRLQYEEIPFPEDYPVTGNLRLKKIDVVLNAHIPSAGPLTRESCIDSYRQAVCFWKKYFQKTSPAICCFSWLLFPAHETFLPPGSNILRFQQDYDIYTTWQDEAFGDLWRITGSMYDGRPENLPEDTSLRRAYKGWITAGNIPGGGTGFLKEDIVSTCTKEVESI